MKMNNENLAEQNVLVKLREWSNTFGTIMCLQMTDRRCQIVDYIKTLVISPNYNGL